MNKKLIVILFALILVYSVLAEDTDGDGMDDAWEILYFKSLTQNQIGDFDKDTVNNLVEFSLKSNPSINDTDSDKFLDGIEYFYATNLTDAKSYPKESANKITLISPRFGTASLNTFTLLVGTANRSTCKTSISPTDKYESIVAQSQLFTTSNSLNHTKQMSISSQIETRLYIYCKTTVGGYTNDAFPKEVLLGVDATKPVISSAIAEPNPVFEKLEVDLISQTDDKTICRYFTSDVSPMSYTAAFGNVSLSEFSTKTTKRLDATTNPAIEDLKTYNVVAVCMNKAEQVDIEPISFYVNLSVSNKILELSPSGITNKAAPMIRVVTNKGSTCRYGEGYVNEFSQINSKDHYYQETNLSSKAYTIPILCQFNDAQVIESSIVFTIDTSAPVAPLVTAKDKTCGKLNVSYSVTEQNLQGYKVKLTDSLGKVLYENVTKDTKVMFDELKANMTLERNKQYFWEIYVMDKAGNNGTAVKTEGTLLLDPNNELCKGNKDPYLKPAAVLTENGIQLDLQCKDDDGSCLSTYYSVLNTSCSACGSCGYKKYQAKFFVSKDFKDSKVCYNITDNKLKAVLGSFEVKLNSCTTGNCCMGKNASVCFANCTAVNLTECHPEKIDTDGDGIADQDEAKCGLDSKISDANLDADGDTLSNEDECLIHLTDLNKKDTDGDGYDDNVEIDKKTSPTDELAYPIDETTDTDLDGIPDMKEDACGLDKKDPADANKDNDGDTLKNKKECDLGTNLGKKDTDGDGYDDNVEVDKKTNPKNKTDFPKSYVLNILMILVGIVLLLIGIFLFIKNSKNKPKAPPSIAKPGPQPQKSGVGQQKGAVIQMPNFFQSSQQVQQPQQAPSYGQQQGEDVATETFEPYQRRQEDTDAPEDLDYQIKKKREEMKIRQMTSVFDEFGKDTGKPKKTVEIVKTETDQEKEDRLFSRLDDISEEDAFEELEKLKRRKR